MNITTVLFDLDGTLLPMDQDVFLKAYIGGLAHAAEPYGYSPGILSASIIAGTKAMVQNDGMKTNEDIFWDAMATTYGQSIRNDIYIFDAFYETEFPKLSKTCGYTPQAAALIEHLKEKGLRTVLATNPLFPKVATETRIRWAGLEPDDFCYFTTYENAHYSKPNLNYYLEILQHLQLSPEECLMVGNDVSDDMVVQQLGMKVFLLTDCLINKDACDISQYPHGDFSALCEYIDML